MSIAFSLSRWLIGSMAACVLAFGASSLAGCAPDSQESSASVEESASSTAETITMPSVVGMTEDAARDKLEKLELNVTVKSKAVSSDDQVGIVVAQDPEESTQLATGDAVTITVGSRASSSAKARSTSMSSASKPTASTTSTASKSPSSAASVSNHMGATDADYDTSTLPKKYRTYYEKGATALADGNYRTLATEVAKLYGEYPNAAQSLVNSAKKQSWYAKFKKQLLKKDSEAENILDLDK